MLKHIWPAVLLTTALLLGAGCYATQEGRVRAGVPFVNDQIISRYELPVETVHNAARTVLERQGTLTTDDSVKKVVSGVVSGSRVWISFDTSELHITKITTQARTTAGAPNVDLASEIDKLIYGTLIQPQP